MLNFIKKNKIKLLIACLFLGCVVLFGMLLKTVSIIYKLHDKLDDDKKAKITAVEKYDKEIQNEKIDKKAIKIPIITVHRTVDHESKIKYFKDDEWVNDLDELDKQLQYLYDNKWNSIDLDQFYCWYIKECEFAEKTFVFTIDDGDAEAYYNILPLLDKYKFTGTLFVIGQDVPEKTEKLNEPTRIKLGMDIIEKLRKEGSRLHFESHSYNEHRRREDSTPIVSIYSIKEMEEDFDLNKKFNFKYYAYPFGYYNRDLLSVISNRPEIKMAFGFHNYNYATRLNNTYEIDRIKVSAKTSFNDFKNWFEYAN